MINTFYQTLLTALNKNQMGKISPSEFNTLANEAIQSIYTEVFSDFRKLNFKNARLQSTPNYGNEAFNLKQVIEYWVEEKEIELEDGKFSLSDNIYLVNSIFDENSEYYKKDINQFNKLLRSGRMKPTKCIPIYTLFDNTIKAFPVPENNKLDLTYYRKPKVPKWTFIIVGGLEMFNPDATDYQDLDIHPMLLHRLFVEVLFLSGLNLREPEIQQYVSQMKQQEIINEQ